jgi:hypothetical protein
MLAHNDHLFPICSPKRLGPPNFSRISLHLEVFVTFRSAESETLGVISDEHGTMSWVDVDGAEIALFDTHIEWMLRG